MDLSKCRRSLERLKAYYEDRLQMLLRLFRYTDWDTRDRSEYREFLLANTTPTYSATLLSPNMNPSKPPAAPMTSEEMAKEIHKLREENRELKEERREHLDEIDDLERKLARARSTAKPRWINTASARPVQRHTSNTILKNQTSLNMNTIPPQGVCVNCVRLQQQIAAMQLTINNLSNEIRMLGDAINNLQSHLRRQGQQGRGWSERSAWTLPECGHG
ncbi:hypothetical protein IWZ00DRAFT_558105 [Phyllosticta capitalensis]